MTSPEETLESLLSDAVPQMAIWASSGKNLEVPELGIDIHPPGAPKPPADEPEIARFIARGNVTTGVHEPTGKPARLVPPHLAVVEGKIQSVAAGAMELVVTDRRLIGSIIGGSPITKLGPLSGRLLVFSFEYAELDEVSYEQKRGLLGTKETSFCALNYRPGGSVHCNVKGRATLRPGAGEDVVREQSTRQLMEAVASRAARYRIDHGLRDDPPGRADQILHGRYQREGKEVVARFVED